MQEMRQAGQGGSCSMCWPMKSTCCMLLKKERAGRKEIALVSVSCFLQTVTSKSRCIPYISWPCGQICSLRSGFQRFPCFFRTLPVFCVCPLYCSDSKHEGAWPSWAQNINNVTFSFHVFGLLSTPNLFSWNHHERFNLVSFDRDRWAGSFPIKRVHITVLRKWEDNWMISGGDCVIQNGASEFVKPRSLLEHFKSHKRVLQLSRFLIWCVLILWSLLIISILYYYYYYYALICLFVSSLVTTDLDLIFVVWVPDRIQVIQFWAC